MICHGTGRASPGGSVVTPLATPYEVSAFVEARNAWQHLKQPMIDKRDLLEVAMKEAGLDKYEFDSKVVAIEKDEKVTVRTKKNKEEDDE